MASSEAHPGPPVSQTVKGSLSLSYLDLNNQ